ncbi:MAG: hypothetical protein GXY82_10340 [Methanospirillum sp.]|nr:hypothetical protein [Methanospirillum sp.]
MDPPAWLLVLTVAIPFAAALLIPFLRSRPDAREAVSLVAAVVTFLACVLSLPSAAAPVPASTPPLPVLPGLSMQLAGDALGLLFASIASLLWVITTVYSIGYMRGLGEHAQTRYYACFAVCIGAVMGVALSPNLFSLFVFYEILAIAAWPLVAHAGTEEALAAGRKYLVYTQSGGVAILAGMMALLAAGDTLEFVPGGNPAVAAAAPEFAVLGFILLLAGFGVKASLVPLHGWLPTAMVAPTPVSGLLHAVAVVNAGVFGILRLLLYLYGPETTLRLGLHDLVVAIAVITILVGSLLALRQDDFKLRLAYSTVSQLSYMILGAAVLLPPGIPGVSDAGRAAAVIGATFAFAAHAFGKLTMFFVAGTVAVETGRRKISELGGLGWRMPWEFGAFALATLSMVGLPPVAGFIAKWYLALGIAGEGAGGWWMLLVLVAASVLNLAYFLPVLMRAYARPGQEEPVRVRPALRGPVLAAAGGTLLLGLWTTIPGGPFALDARIALDVTHTASAALNLALAAGPVPPFAIYLAAAPLVLVLSGRARQVALVAAGALGLVQVLILPGGLLVSPPAGGAVFWNLPFMGYAVTLLRVDGLSYPMGVIFGVITLFALLYAAAVARPRIHLYALLYAGTALGVVFAGDWITLLVMWELMAVASTFLIWQEAGARGAGYRYLLFHGLGGALLAGGIALLYMGGGPAAVGPLSLVPEPLFRTWAAVLIVLGAGVNAAFVPLHVWLPDAYSRAHFAASVFLCVYTTKVAVYLLARAAPGSEWVAAMGALMAVYGVVFAVLQSDMRRLLSYHIVSQVGYMVAGVGLFGWLGAASAAGQLGLDGGMAHAINNILFKTLLFMVAGAILLRTGEGSLARLGGLQRRMPVTALAFWVAAFSIAGVPLFNGYVSKGMVLAAAGEASPWLWLLLEIASFGTALSFLKLGYFAFLRPGDLEASDPPRPMQAAMLGIAALCVVIGVYPAALGVLLPASALYEPFAPEHLAGALVVLAAAGIAFFAWGRRALAPHGDAPRDVDLAWVAAARSVCRGAGLLEGAFSRVYAGALRAAGGLFAAGSLAGGMEERDLNWNVAVFGTVLVALLLLVLVGAGL